MRKMADEPMTFETALKKLEKVVQELEKEEVPLEKAIELYQEGMQLSKSCDDKLKNAENKSLTDNALQSLFYHCEIAEQLKKLMLYSVLADGKRLRPVLLFSSYSSFTDNSISKTKKTAMALEMIHSYSLIHDDLPAMD